MPKLRLLGLVLMITSVFLAMAAAATRTTHVRIGGSASPKDEEPASASAEAVQNPAATGQEQAQANDRNLAASDEMEAGEMNESREVSVVWPLAASTAVGMVLWFGPAGAAELRGQGGKPRRRKRRKTKSRRSRR